jgi:hypothetical protein
MRLEIDQIQDRVARTEDEQSAHRKMMDQWEEMWKLDAGYKTTWRETVMKDGREQVTTPDPYNVVNLAMRLIPTDPKIDVPPREETEDANTDAQQIERFLTAMYPRVNYQQGKNFVEEHKWQLFTLGRSPLQALWIKDDLPEKIRKRQFPILIRTLDPRNVGIKRGPHYVEWAYHKYEAEKLEVRQQYPDLKRWDEPKPSKPTDNESHLVTVTDFWYRAKNGSVWHAIIVENEFALEPRVTDYPVIPIIDAVGDHDAMSILHPINGLWQYKCRLASNLGTAVLWYTWPFFLVESPMGHEQNDIVVRPGSTQHAVEGTKIQEVRPQANAQLLESMLAKVDTNIQQSTFPGVLYGDAGNMQAGYGINILSQAATGRVQPVREAMERSLMQLNELVLMLIDVFDDDGDGVELWGRDEGSGKLYKTCLYKKQIAGYYENAVQLKVSTPQDDIQLQTLGIRLADGKYISKQTLWDKYLKITVPSDEQRRIYAEMALDHPEVQKVLSVTRLIEAYPETWEAMIKGTPLEQMAYRIASEVLELPIELPPPPPMPEQPPMPPPGMNGPMPPQGPMMPPGPPPIQPGAELVGPMGGGIPPEMQGQMQGESMGMPPDMDPALFAQIMGLPMGSGESLSLLGGAGNGM